MRDGLLALVAAAHSIEAGKEGRPDSGSMLSERPGGGQKRLMNAHDDRAPPRAKRASLGGGAGTMEVVTPPLHHPQPALQQHGHSPLLALSSFQKISQLNQHHQHNQQHHHPQQHHQPAQLIFRRSSVDLLHALPPHAVGTAGTTAGTGNIAPETGGCNGSVANSACLLVVPPNAAAAAAPAAAAAAVAPGGSYHHPPLTAAAAGSCPNDAWSRWVSGPTAWSSPYLGISYPDAPRGFSPRAAGYQAAAGAGSATACCHTWLHSPYPGMCSPAHPCLTPGTPFPVGQPGSTAAAAHRFQPGPSVHTPPFAEQHRAAAATAAARATAESPARHEVDVAGGAALGAVAAGAGVVARAVSLEDAPAEEVADSMDVAPAAEAAVAADLEVRGEGPPLRAHTAHTAAAAAREQRCFRRTSGGAPPDLHLGLRSGLPLGLSADLAPVREVADDESGAGAGGGGSRGAGELCDSPRCALRAASHQMATQAGGWPTPPPGGDGAAAAAAASGAAQQHGGSAVAAAARFPPPGSGRGLAGYCDYCYDCSYNQEAHGAHGQNRQQRVIRSLAPGGGVLLRTRSAGSSGGPPLAAGPWGAPAPYPYVYPYLTKHVAGGPLHHPSYHYHPYGRGYGYEYGHEYGYGYAHTYGMASAPPQYSYACAGMPSPPPRAPTQMQQQQQQSTQKQPQKEVGEASAPIAATAAAAAAAPQPAAAAGALLCRNSTASAAVLAQVGHELPSAPAAAAAAEVEAVDAALAARPKAGAARDGDGRSREGNTTGSRSNSSSSSNRAPPCSDAAPAPGFNHHRRPLAAYPYPYPLLYANPHPYYPTPHGTPWLPAPMPFSDGPVRGTAAATAPGCGGCDTIPAAKRVRSYSYSHDYASTIVYGGGPAGPSAATAAAAAPCPSPLPGSGAAWPQHRIRSDPAGLTGVSRAVPAAAAVAVAAAQPGVCAGGGAGGGHGSAWQGPKASVVRRRSRDDMESQGQGQGQGLGHVRQPAGLQAHGQAEGGSRGAGGGQHPAQAQAHVQAQVGQGVHAEGGAVSEERPSKRALGGMLARLHGLQLKL